MDLREIKKVTDPAELKTPGDRLTWARLNCKSWSDQHHNKKKIGRKDIAELIGISEMAYGFVERGETDTMSFEVIDVVCDYLDIRIEWMIRGVGRVAN